MYVASSNSSTTSSDSSTTSDLCVVTNHRNGDRHSVGSVLPPSNAGSRGQRSHKSTRGLTTTSQQKIHQAPPTLQSLVKTKCWSIAPLWKFVTYELETQPDQVRVVFFIFAFSIVLRDIEERGRDLENVLFQYTNLVKPAFEEFCLPVSIMHTLLNQVKM